MEQEIKHKHEDKHEEAVKHEEHKMEEKKKLEIKKEKREFAIINGKDLPISLKHSMYICNFIKGKTIEESIHLLEQVLNYKIALPMKGEVPHRHGMTGKVQIGRYPQKATKEFIRLLKSLNANASVNGIDNPIIFRGVPNQASKPHRRFGSGRFKRVHVYLEAREKKEIPAKKEKK